MRFAVLVPAYQAAAHLGRGAARTCRRWPTRWTRWWWTTDRATRTAQVARQLGARVLSFAGNRGKGHALLAGFEALADYDGVVTLDADGQHPPECVPGFVAAAEAGADLVLGVRRRSSAMPPLRRLANGWSSGVGHLDRGPDASRTASAATASIGRAVLQRTPVTPRRYEVETEIAVRARAPRLPPRRDSGAHGLRGEQATLTAPRRPTHRRNDADASRSKRSRLRR